MVDHTPPKLTKDEAHIREELYKQNLDLADRNKTLALLRAIDEIVLSSEKDVDVVASRIVDTILTDADFRWVAVYLNEGTALMLKATALNMQSKETEQIQRALMNHRVSLRPRSILSLSLKKKKVHSTEHLFELLPASAFSMDDAEELQKNLNLVSVFVCPLIVRGEAIGALAIGVRMPAKDVSEYRRNLIDRLTGVVGIAIDNALLYQQTQVAAKRLRTANRNLKALDKAKDEFISMASHQLRTPLTTIKGYLSMMLEGDAGKVTKEQQEFLNYAFGGAERMVSLISDLLNVSRLAAGRFLIEKQPTDLVAVVADEVRQLQSHAAAKHLDLIFDQPKEKVPLINIDEGKTRQVIMNFIDNAIYYTKQGSVTVSLEYDKNMMRVKVRDTGIGVPEAAKEKLFGKFFRAENAQVARPDGTGLGLYLAKKVVEEQGGTIIFESKEGEGSTFGFEMPFKASTKK